ncbi:sulfatase-like hydrolase/transferase [Granulosicoccus sp. 3-233]|uniref:sulfatase-like hydrolase/transferase n=1 Tax=Granulosicoccus sp. 3-233 TaxID=3417969 RepID=UPI003D34CCD4
MPHNTLIIMSDEHSRKVMGCYGNSLAHTPHLDALAERGTVFENAYCNSPICVPSRASLHTGLYPHQIRYWDNAMPYDGRVSSWGHALQRQGKAVTSIGKLHFRDSDADTGFDEQILPLHVKDGIGDPSTLLRRNPPERPGTRQLAAMTGKGETPYWQYDEAVARATEQWLKEPREQGWTLFVSFVLPHFPLNAPQQFRDLFDANDLPLPKMQYQYTPENEVMTAMRALLDFNDHFQDEQVVREAVANYYALAAALDSNVGRVLQALDASGLMDDTNIIYTSDHGDNLGARGYWGKSTLWEESVGVPLVMAGPDIPAARRNTTPVSLIDLYPTVTALAGIDDEVIDVKSPRPGLNLAELAADEQPQRAVFAEYHAVGARDGLFMLRQGRYKLIDSPGSLPLLYDLQADPEETCNLAADAEHRTLLVRMQNQLRAIAEPESVNEQAFADQHARALALGGEAVIRGITPVAFTHPGDVSVKSTH